MSKEDIEKAVKEAEQYAEEDKKRREAVDARNAAESMVFSTEKSLDELGDKIPVDEKANIRSKIDAAKEALKGEDMDKINQTSEDLKNTFYAAYENVMKQAQAAGAQPTDGAAPNGNAAPQDGVYDAEYKDVDDNNQK